MQKFMFKTILGLGTIHCLAVSTDNKYIVSGSDEKSLKVFDLENKKELHHLSGAHASNETFVEQL